MRYSVHALLRRIMVFLAFAAMVQACQESATEQDPDSSLHTVRVETVGQATSEGLRRFVGRVDALSTVDLSFQVGGQIINMPVQQGTIVPAGGLIAKLDTADYVRAVREARVALDLAELEYERNRLMLTKGAIPRATYDRAYAELEMRKLALDAAERNLGYTRIEAPFDALITRRLVDSFTQVGAGTPAVRVQDVTELRTRISIPENMMELLKAPERFVVTAEISAHPGRQFELTYREHATEADPVTQTYEISLGMPRLDGINILPGMTATVTIQPRESHLAPLIDIPVAALDTSENGDFRVWVYNPETDEVTPRQVNVGGLGSSRINVISGLEAGEQIVSAGAHLLRDGMRVIPFGRIR